jgi:hypothetical protein
VTEHATYLYAVAGTPDIPELPNMVGISGAPLRLIGSEPCGVVSTVSLAEFDEQALRRNLENQQWLEKTATAHHRVVEAVNAAGPTAPVRLCTVYRDDDRVGAMLREQATVFRATLERLTGRREWGVQVFTPARAPESPQPTASTSPGTAYLQKLRSQRDQRAERDHAMAAQAENVHATMAEFSVASRRYPPQDPRLTGNADPMILNAAYLVDVSAEAALAQHIARFERAGLDVRLTGPWAPYSFVELDTP